MLPRITIIPPKFSAFGFKTGGRRMNSRVKKIAMVAAAGVAVAMVLTACSRVVSTQPVVGGPNGITVQMQSTVLEQAAPVEEAIAPLQSESQQAPVSVSPATTTKVEEKPAAPVPATAAESAKASEQVKSAEKAAAQAQHHCSGYGGFDD
jgi:hypothetical protein